MLEQIFKKISVKEHLEKVKKEFFENPHLWYEVIIPREAADRLYKECNGDYSLIWHDHCCDCFGLIDRGTEYFYISEDESEWLCENCYKKRMGEN